MREEEGTALLEKRNACYSFRPRGTRKGSRATDNQFHTQAAQEQLKLGYGQ